MATHRLPILGFGAVPDSTGEVFFQPYSILATNDYSPRQIARFGSNNAAQPTVSMQLHGGFTVPKNYVGTAVIVYVWTATITSGVVRWGFWYNTFAGDDTTSMDPASYQEGLNFDDTAPGAAHRRMEVSSAATSANFAVDDEVTFSIIRDGTHANDTMAGSAILFSAFFQYADV